MFGFVSRTAGKLLTLVHLRRIGVLFPAELGRLEAEYRTAIRGCDEPTEERRIAQLNFQPVSDNFGSLVGAGGNRRDISSRSLLRESKHRGGMHLHSP